MIDFPDQVEQSEATKKQNAALQEKFRIEAYPTLLLLDAKGRPYSEAEMVSEVDAHAEQLQELSKKRSARDEKFAAAKKLIEVEKAEALRDAISAMEINSMYLPEFYSAELAELKAADPEDTLGVAKMVKAGAALAEMDEDLTTFYEEQKWDAGIKRIDQYIETYKPTGTDLQEVLGNKLFFHEFNGDFKAAVAVTEEIMKIDPDSDLGKDAITIKQNFLDGIAEEEEKAKKAKEEAESKESKE